MIEWTCAPMKKKITTAIFCRCGTKAGNRRHDHCAAKY